MNTKTKKITTVGMLSALAYAVVVVGRVPLVLFLKYDPKDIVIAIGGLIFGPLTSFSVSVIVSLVEMVTISENGVFGCIMNIISSCSFACTAAFIYKRRHTLSGAIIGLVSGWGIMIAVMMLWNYLIAPLYMGYPREAVVELLIPAFLPFNLIKGGLNAAQFAALGASNAFQFQGTLPEDKDTLAAALDKIIETVKEDDLREYRINLRHL